MEKYRVLSLYPLYQRLKKKSIKSRQKITFRRFERFFLLQFSKFDIEFFRLFSTKRQMIRHRLFVSTHNGNQSSQKSPPRTHEKTDKPVGAGAHDSPYCPNSNQLQTVPSRVVEDVDPYRCEGKTAPFPSAHPRNSSCQGSHFGGAVEQMRD